MDLAGAMFHAIVTGMNIPRLCKRCTRMRTPTHGYTQNQGRSASRLHARCYSDHTRRSFTEGRATVVYKPALCLERRLLRRQRQKRGSLHVHTSNSLVLYPVECTPCHWQSVADGTVQYCEVLVAGVCNRYPHSSIRIEKIPETSNRNAPTKSADRGAFRRIHANGFKQRRPFGSVTGTFRSPVRGPRPIISGFPRCFRDFSCLNFIGPWRAQWTWMTET